MPFGVVATSEPILEEEVEDINASVRLLEELGVNVKFGKYAYSNPTGYRRDSKAQSRRYQFYVFR